MARMTKNEQRKRRHRRIRNTISGSAETPRLCVFRSNKGIEAQVINDRDGVTIAAASWVEPDIRKLDRKDRAAAVGKIVAERAQKEGVKKVAFDRGGYLYHGRVKNLADSAREAGLTF